MKHIKTWGVFFTAVLAVIAIGGASFADFLGDTNKIVSDFNGLNSGEGFYFKYPDNIVGVDHYPYVVRLTTANGYENNVDIGAYTGAGTSGTVANLRFFNTFCVEPNNYTGIREDDKQTGSTLVGTLNYSGNMSQTTESRKLSVGAALLYKLYATGDILLNTEAKEEHFIQILRGLMEIVDNVANPDIIYKDFVADSKWATDSLLMQLRAEAPGVSISDLKANYDPGKYYDFIGDYSVFVMTVETQGGADSQDFLYIAKHGSSDVPEPGALLLWMLGSLGVVGTSWVRRRRLKKLA